MNEFNAIQLKQIRDVTVEVIGEVMPVLIGGVATKTDLEKFATKEDFRSLNARFDIFESKFKLIDDKFESMDNQFDKLTGLVIKIAETHRDKLEQIRDRLHDHEKRIQKLELA